MPTPGELTRRCPYCSAYPTPFAPLGGAFTTSGTDGETRSWQPASCPACGGVVVMELANSDSHVLTVHPESVGKWEVAHLPEAVQRDWEEAVKVFGTSAFSAAVVMCGRTLEAGADARHVTGKTLGQRTTRMLNDGLITAEFKEAMSYVRLIRNTGAHAGQIVSRESAEGTMRFTMQALRLLFEVPGELRRLQEPTTEELGAEEPEDAALRGLGDLP